MIRPQKLSRRTVLAGGIGTLALLVIAPQMSTAGTPEPYTYEAWLPLLGQDLAADGGSILHLAKVEDLRRPALAGEVDSGADRFRLHFTLLSGTFASETVTVTHPQAGPVDLFTTQSFTTQNRTIQGDAVQNRTVQGDAIPSGGAEGIATAVACIDRRGALLLPPQN